MRAEDLNVRRLKEARLFRGISLEDLANQTGVNKKDLQCFEDRRYLPIEDNVWKVSRALKIPIKFFYEKDKKNIKVENTFFKTNSRMQKIDEISSKEKLVLIHKIHEFMKKHAELPELVLPNKEDKFSDIEGLARITREAFGVGDSVIENMSELLQSKGFILSDINLKEKNASIFTQIHSVEGELSYLIALGNDNGSAPLRNYDLAFELANILAHHFKIQTKKMPREDFACAFLLPRKQFLKDLKNPEDLNLYIELKRKWRVEITVLLYRAYQLGELNYKKYNALMNEISKHGWIGNEPLKSGLKDNTKLLLRKTTDELFLNNEMSRSGLVELLSYAAISLNAGDVEMLMGLKHGALVERQQ